MRERWLKLMRRLGVSEELAQQVFEELLRRYNEPHRVAHTLGYVAFLLTELEHIGPDVNKEELELALWFLKSIYRIGQEDNTKRSALFAYETLVRLTGNKELAQRVASLILSTKMGETNVRERALICDLTLAIYGQEWPMVEAYEARNRAEYAGVPDKLYAQERHQVLRALVAPPFLFRTKEFAQRIEPKARSNLRRLIAQLATMQAR